MTKDFTIVNKCSGVYMTSSEPVCDVCFAKLSEDIDFSDIEEPFWKDIPGSGTGFRDWLSLNRDRSRVYHIGIYLKDDPKWDEEFCGVCGKHRGFIDTLPFHLMNKLRSKLMKQISYYRVYRKLMEFLPKDEVDKLVKVKRR